MNNVITFLCELGFALIILILCVMAICFLIILIRVFVSSIKEDSEKDREES